MLMHKGSGIKIDQAGSKGMAPRAFRGKTMTAALAAVEKALGNEALIVAVHPSPPTPAWQLWQRSGVEVVAMPSAVAAQSSESEATSPVADSEPDPASTDRGAIPRTISSRPPESAGGGAFANSPGGVHAKEQTAAESAVDIPRPLLILRDRLVDQGVDEGWIRQMIRSIRERSNPMALGDPALARELVRQELHASLRSDNGACLMRNRVIGIVGVCGSGKTGACAKIAAYGFKSLGKQVHWISTDTLRAGAIAKAQACTAPLGIPLHLAYSSEALTSFLRWDSDSDLFLIDTPGCNPYRKEELEELRALFAEIPERLLLLMTPATGKESDLQDMYRAYAGLGIGGLIVSKLDETRSYGELFNFLRLNQLPVAFLIDGARIYGDPHAGEISLLVNRLLDEPSAESLTQ
jgi:flagellar biosynthesis protein FlhF